MDRGSRHVADAGRTSDGALVAIPMIAMLLVIFPIGPIGPIGALAGLLLAVIGLLIAYGRPPSRHRTSLVICSVIALIGTGAVTVALAIDWLR